MSKFLAGLCIAICAHGAASAADKLPSVPSNLDFEEGARHWRVPRTKWRVEDGAGRGGSKGMIGENYDPHSYSFPGQRIALEGGAVYRFGCWVKGKIMKDGKTILPSVSLDWSDANGKWLSAAYAFPVASNEPNTDGWVRYEGLTSPLPDEAVSGTLLCFLTRGATGKVQFDDFFFRSEESRPVDWLRKNLKGADYDKAMDDVKAVMASVKRREAIILSDPGPSATTDAAHLPCRTWMTASGETWLLLSNANRGQVTATVKLGAAFRATAPDAGVSATLTSPAVLSVELAPLASGFVRLVP